MNNRDSDGDNRGDSDSLHETAKSKGFKSIHSVSNLPIMAGHFLYEQLSPYEQQFYKPCGTPHGVSCQVYIEYHEEQDFYSPTGYKRVVDNIMPHYWLNYDKRIY